MKEHWAVHKRLLPVLGGKFEDLDAIRSTLAKLVDQPLDTGT